MCPSHMSEAGRTPLGFASANLGRQGEAASARPPLKATLCGLVRGANQGTRREAKLIQVRDPIEREVELCMIGKGDEHHSGRVTRRGSTNQTFVQRCARCELFGGTRVKLR